MAWTPPPVESNNNMTLNEYELKELSIIKQAILKSAIEGGVITKLTGDTDEEFIARWVKFCRRNEQKDHNMFKEQELPF
jgi:hypothetical protein